MYVLALSMGTTCCVGQTINRHNQSSSFARQLFLEALGAVQKTWLASSCKKTLQIHLDACTCLHSGVLSIKHARTRYKRHHRQHDANVQVTSPIKVGRLHTSHKRKYCNVESIKIQLASYRRLGPIGTNLLPQWVAPSGRSLCHWLERCMNVCIARGCFLL